MPFPCFTLSPSGNSSTTTAATTTMPPTTTTANIEFTYILRNPPLVGELAARWGDLAFGHWSGRPVRRAARRNHFRNPSAVDFIHHVYILLRMSVLFKETDRRAAPSSARRPVGPLAPLNAIMSGHLAFSSVHSLTRTLGCLVTHSNTHSVTDSMLHDGRDGNARGVDAGRSVGQPRAGGVGVGGRRPV